MILRDIQTDQAIEVPDNFLDPVPVQDPSADLEKLIADGRFLGQADIPAELYHAAPGLSYSALKEFAKSPAHYQAHRRKEKRREVIGTGTHMRTLQPELFESKLVRIQDRRGKRTELAAGLEAEGKFVVTENEYTQICRQSDAIMNDADCRHYLSRGKAEQALFWDEPVVDPVTGDPVLDENGEPMVIRCRSLVDWLRDDGIMLDLKYFNSVDAAEVEKQIYRMKYHWQTGFYTRGGRAVLGSDHDMFVHIVVTDEDPFVARPFCLNDPSIEKARFEYAPLLQRFLECRRTNRWPAYERPAEGITTLALPEWAWR